MTKNQKYYLKGKEELANRLSRLIRNYKELFETQENTSVSNVMDILLQVIEEVKNDTDGVI